MGVFECDASGATLPAYDGITRHGLQAQHVLMTARTKNRGVPLTPLLLVVDLYFGYQAGIGPGQWNALNYSTNDKAFPDLLERQLFAPSGLPDEELKTTPFGEIADVSLSDADPAYFRLYPSLLLVGDHDFAAAAPTHSDLPEVNLAGRLLAALQPGGCAELLLQQYHVDAMGPAAWAPLRATSKAKIIADPGEGKAVADEELVGVGRRHLPVVVANASLADGTPVAILWQVNAQPGGGFVLELSNGGLQSCLFDPMWPYRAADVLHCRARRRQGAVRDDGAPAGRGGDGAAGAATARQKCDGVGVGGDGRGRTSGGREPPDGSCSAWQHFLCRVRGLEVRPSPRPGRLHNGRGTVRHALPRQRVAAPEDPSV
jgi:hypothetical protein